MLRFDEFRLDPAALQLFRGDGRLDAPPQAVEVLAYLIDNRGRTVGRQELLDRFWPRAGTGGDASLNTCIRRIRALLGDEADAPRHIQTRPRSGYRFIGTVHAAPAAGAPRRSRRLAMAGGLLATLAVSGAVWAQGAVFRPQHRIAIERVQGLCEYILFPKFDAGLRESFMAEVSNTLPKGYSIAAPGSGDGADLLARISVRQTPRQTVVVVNLVDRGGGRLLWSGQFVGATDTNDYLPLQRALAQHMARGLRKALAERA
ncbi:MAG: winged helix-turn-helix domain-containing protein [Sphingomonas sp.]|uniref:winged helix-turn-helix domain-containing protein n=1 Tax=Sphingomonas sp. TaxID=28214 RepID=UPI0025E9268D|nr:winged helix-turn-helix domain-containing protein [Sphingomonas sp.]MBQ1499903.1 winged helix-turn-helix domain-containing protein [Sphingomonas sp.]